MGSVERGERNVSILNLRLIARVLRVPLSELLQDTSGKAGEAWVCLAQAVRCVGPRVAGHFPRSFRTSPSSRCDA
ncbi:MAG: helix-turn-helix domain-containing protein [Opitutales bacterium]